MDTRVQFSVFLANKPGVLPQVCRELGKAKINIIALTMMDAVEHGVFRMIAKDPDKVREVLKKLNVPMTETEVMVITMANRPGALADVCEKLSSAHVAISYMYCTTGAAGGKTLGVFKVANIKKAAKIIENHKSTARDTKAKLRRGQTNPTPRRRAAARR